MFLFKVEQTFLITGLGLVLTPGLGNKNIATPGTKIKLVRPDKTVLRTHIHGVTFEGKHAISVGQNFTKDDVPIGTEVWIDN